MKRLFLWVVSVCAVLHLAARELNIVYIGNSITRGATLEHPATEAPPVHASRWVEENSGIHVNFRNCGISGMTTLNFLPISGQVFPKVVQAAAELSENGGEMIFSISLGTNDSASTMTFGGPVPPEQYYTNLMVIIDELLRLYPGCKVVVQNPLWYSPNTIQ